MSIPVPSDCTAGVSHVPPARAARDAAVPQLVTGGLSPGVPPVAGDRPSPSSLLGRAERGAVEGCNLPAEVPAIAGEALPGRPVPPVAGRPGQGERRTWMLELPPGLPLLSLNGREHWAARHRKTQALKKAAWAMALQAKIPPLERVTITAEYQPPDRRHRDADNPVAAVKACVDGIVASGCLPADDSRYVAWVKCTIGPVYPKGRLVIHITEVARGVPGGAA